MREGLPYKGEHGDVRCQETLHDKEYAEWLRKPVVTSRGKCYLIFEGKIAGKVRASVGYSGPVNTGIAYLDLKVVVDDDDAADFFGLHSEPSRKFAHFEYDGITGRPMISCDEDPIGRRTRTSIVDIIDFDFGIAHPSFADIEGFGNATKTNHLRVRIQQKRRRSRTSNKIRKAAVV